MTKKANTKKRRIGGYARVRKYNEERKDYPNREEQALLQAIERAKLPLLDWLHEEQNDEGWCGWYTALVETSWGKSFIDLQGKGGKDVKIQKKKKKHAADRGIPYLEVKGTSVNQIWAQIEHWKMMLNREKRIKNEK